MVSGDICCSNADSETLSSYILQKSNHRTYEEATRLATAPPLSQPHLEGNSNLSAQLDALLNCRMCRAILGLSIEKNAAEEFLEELGIVLNQTARCSQSVERSSIAKEEARGRTNYSSPFTSYTAYCDDYEGSQEEMGQVRSRT